MKITKNSTKKIVTATLATTMIFATPISLVVPSTPVFAEQNIQASPIADETSTRSITLWKYAVSDTSELGNEGTGSAVEVNKDPLPGIKFTVKKVEAIGNATLVNGLVAKEGRDYNIIDTLDTITTDENGMAKVELGVGTKVDGIYLLEELDDDRVAKPVDPFFVIVPQTNRENQSSLIYDVEVQPKNIVESLLNPDKTAEEGKGFSIKAGMPFKWEASANIPSGLYTVINQDMIISPVYNELGEIVADLNVSTGDEIYANYYRITDELVKELLLDDVKVEALDTTGSWNGLEFNKDYSVVVNGEEQTETPITDESDDVKKVVVSLTETGMKKVTKASDEKIRVVYTTHVDKDYNGMITNHMDVSFLTPGLKPVTKPSTSDPEYYTGGFDIEKTATDKVAPYNKLSGAEFHIADSKANADKGIYLASDGKSYDSQLTTMPTGIEFLTAVSDASGLASFNGLVLNWYDDDNNNGKQDPDEPTYNKEDIKKSYWVVETKAPAGYQLLKEAQKVVVDLSTAGKDLIELEVKDTPNTKLPFTGGEGTKLIVSIALGAIAIGIVAIGVDKKRRGV
ncbi:SpaH/EbpB family LPXTG-anchored major pilin [Enterococcus faecalis]|uniref:SpaH/EbpB family LPXTG-anchored major pilin n=1 Tax=Enterococcus faecalis TaxID=1351 RepID=UPI001A06C2A4|nr:SpaH/EbpB family LPXTG-anchored major pilin [Enterococcus faecalis]EGO6705160.1 SpaH/EbpB family LPXTG-anchored major pilin [Enterococcus faecalis]